MLDYKLTIASVALKCLLLCLLTSWRPRCNTLPGEELMYSDHVTFGGLGGEIDWRRVVYQRKNIFISVTRKGPWIIMPSSDESVTTGIRQNKPASLKLSPVQFCLTYSTTYSYNKYS